MKLISWNVNGLRACVTKGFISFLDTYDPDIIGIQETKLQYANIPSEIHALQSHYTYWSFAEKAGYSGVGLFSKKQPKNTSYTIDDERFNGEGRIIRADYDDFTLLNIYFPNGQMNEQRLQYKLQFYDQFLVYVQTLRNLQPNIIIIGDFNTAHKEIDLANPKENAKFSGFLPIERAWLDTFISQGFIDTFRHFDTNPHNYSWWTFRANARARNIGWRIDYCFVSSECLQHVTNAFILPNVTGSDHCPVGIEYV